MVTQIEDFYRCHICGYNIPPHLVGGHMLCDLGWHFNYEARDDTDSQSYWLIRFWGPEALGKCRYIKGSFKKPYIVHFEGFKSAFYKFQEMYIVTLSIMERYKNGLF